MLTSLNLPGGIVGHGFPTFGLPVFTTGTTFFVQSTGANASNDPRRGKSPSQPFSSIDYAVGQCTANAGDVIVVMPGHVETVTAAAGLDLDVAGITLIGVGSGSLRPQINFTTAVGADMDVDAANITICNFLFTGGIDALTGPIDVNAADCKLFNIETRDVTGQATDFIVTDATCDRLMIDGWRHGGAAAAGADTAISIVGGDWIQIRNFSIDGNFAVAGIENVTTAATNLHIGGGHAINYIRTRNAADIAITLVATATGNVGPNIMIRLQDDAANITECLVGADMQFFDPIMVCNADGERGLQYNGATSADL